MINPTRLDDRRSTRSAPPARDDVAFAAGFSLPSTRPRRIRARCATRPSPLAAGSRGRRGLPRPARRAGVRGLRPRRHRPARRAARAARRRARGQPAAPSSCSPTAASWRCPFADRVPAILEGWLLGQAGGGAIADVLYGVVNPSGKLTETIPLRLEDTPAFLNFPGEDGHVRYGEGLFVGYRWYDARKLDVAFPFGHGLSYTTLRATADAAASVERGRRHRRARDRHEHRRPRRPRGRAGLHGAAGPPPCSARSASSRRSRSVALEPGESREVVLHGPSRRPRVLGRRAPTAGSSRAATYTVDVAASSRDIRSSATVDGRGRRGRAAADARVLARRGVRAPRGRTDRAGRRWRR